MAVLSAPSTVAAYFAAASSGAGPPAAWALAIACLAAHPRCSAAKAKVASAVALPAQVAGRSARDERRGFLAAQRRCGDLHGDNWHVLELHLLVHVPPNS